MLHLNTHASRSFPSSNSGTVSVLFAIGLVALVGIAGSAVDYSLTAWRKAKLQEALDAAVLAGVSDRGDAEQLSGVDGGLTKGQRIEIAQVFFDGNKSSLPNVENVSFLYEGDHLVGHASIKVDTYLLRVAGFNKFDVNILASAASAVTREPLCFMAMHPTRKHTLELKGSVSVLAPECNIYGNSNHEDDVVDPHTPHNFLVGKSVQAVGYGHHFLPNVTPPLEHAPELIPDPLAGFSLPVAGPCDFTNTVVNGTSTTLNPGTYCGGLQIESGAVVNLNPGLYIISGDKFGISDSEVNGADVTVALADSNVKLEWQKSIMRWSATKTGTFAGLALIGSREPVDHVFQDSTIDLHGVIYLLQGAIQWTNSGTPAINALWSAWIVDGVSWDGDGAIHYNFNLADSDVPYPPEMRVIPRPGNARLVK